MKLLLLLLTLPMIGFGQNVNIPDAFFKAYLVNNTAINTNGDNEIQVSEASVFNGGISVAGSTFSNLTGIEAFVSLTWLYCVNTQYLTSLNVSGCTALTTLTCSNNFSLTSIDLSACPALTTLPFYGNDNLTSLNVSTCSALTNLDIAYNSLSSLDVSANTLLTNLACNDNQLTSLNVKNGNNINMDYFHAGGNLNLSCIEVDNVDWSNFIWTNID